MESQQLERIRMLENRMRRQSKVGAPPNEQSLKSIKSTDSKKMMPVLHKLKQEPHEESRPDQSIARLPQMSEEDLRLNRKITDYFPLRKQSLMISSPITKGPCDLDQIRQPAINSQSQGTRSPCSPEDNKSPRGGSNQDSLREQVRILREKLKEKQELLTKFRSEIVESTIKLHKIQRNQLRLRVSNNKIRLGEYLADKKGREQWIDGTEIKQMKEKIDLIQKQKEQLEKSKRQARRGKDGEQSQQLKISLTSQSYFLSREEGHYTEVIKRLQEEKALHIREYKLLFEEEHSHYGRLEAGGGVGWPKIRKYQVLGLLGKGGFSQVYKGFDTEQLKEVAIKVHEFHSNWSAASKQNYLKHALRQSNVHKMLIHPNIVQLYDTVQIDPSSFCTVLQFCQGPDLSYYLKKHKKIPQKQAKLIIRQVVNAIRYLHELPDKVIHYDLKPQNILFHKGRVKITDFGLCKTTKEEVMQLTSQGVGTYWYLPPECFVSDQKAMITPKVDVWSIGVIYYEMIFGEKPFGNQMSQMRILNEGIMLKASVVNFPLTQKGLISNESKEFIKDCLSFSVDQRIDIKVAANHRLFQKK